VPAAALHLLDETGQTLRYATVREKGKRVAARPDEKQFDLLTAAAALHDVGTLVLYGVSGVLDDYGTYQRDMQAAYGDS
jgi:hypothetical protein